jgi:hypothetical protein
MVTLKVYCSFEPNRKDLNGELNFMALKHRIHGQGGPSPEDQRFVMDVDGEFQNSNNGVIDKMKVRVVLRDNETLCSNIFTNKAITGKKRIKIHLVVFHEVGGAPSTVQRVSPRLIQHELYQRKADFRNRDVSYGPIEQFAYDQLVLQCTT